MERAGAGGMPGKMKSAYKKVYSETSRENTAWGTSE